MNHLMVDIESLDVRPSTIVLSIGAVVFDEQVILCKFYRNLFLSQQSTRTMSESTLRWWFKQDQSARDALEKDPVTPVEALTDLKTLYHSLSCQRVWANGIVFDIAALESLCEQFKVPIPWAYNAARDLREMRDEFPAIKIPRVGVEHNALDDAIYQATYVQAIWQERRRRTTLIEQFIEERASLAEALAIAKDERLAAEAIALKRSEYEKRLRDARGHITSLMRERGDNAAVIERDTAYLIGPVLP